MNVLVCNAGSSSLKFCLREAEGERLLLDGAIDWSSKAARLVPRPPGRPAVTRDLRVRRHGEAVARLIEKLRDRALNHESGLLGVSGLSPDMRVLLAAMQENADARLAINVYVHRLRQTIGAMAAVLGGVDALVFTAGVGENPPETAAGPAKTSASSALKWTSRPTSAARPTAILATLHRQRACSSSRLAKT
jgi:acetate kinase